MKLISFLFVYSSLAVLLQTSDKGATKEELALKFGLVNPHHAEMEFLGSAGVNVHLHPPFLLHTTAHRTRTLGDQWHHVIVSFIPMY